MKTYEQVKKLISTGQNDDLELAKEIVKAKMTPLNVIALLLLIAPHIDEKEMIKEPLLISLMSEKKIKPEAGLMRVAKLFELAHDSFPSIPNVTIATEHYIELVRTLEKSKLEHLKE